MGIAWLPCEAASPGDRCGQTSAPPIVQSMAPQSDQRFYAGADSGFRMACRSVPTRSAAAVTSASVATPIAFGDTLAFAIARSRSTSPVIP